MNTRHILLCLALSLLGAGLQAQTDLPQVFSPNAAELGKYGKIPVSYFNGLPNITIPLTELRAKNYTLPIYLTYHAGGNKPDQHPGWVGLGWTLHAGGCINRIVRGLKDESTKEERGMITGGTPPNNPGYLFQGEAFQNKDWTQEALLDSLIRTPFPFDSLPDEFQINIEGIHASFYYVGGGDFRIVSKDPVTFSVDYMLSPSSDETIPLLNTVKDFNDVPAKKMSYIIGFVITKGDGTRYHFGGDDDYIEFDVVQNGDNRVLSGISPYDHGWNGIATANTWMLRRIELPDGESITFEYERKGTPVIKRDVHAFRQKYINGQLDADESTLNPEEQRHYANIHYTFLKPLYLKSIDFKMTKNHYVFHSSKTQELDYKISDEEFVTRMGRPVSLDTLNRYNYFCKLDSITSESGKNFHFKYSSNTNERLKLLSVVRKDGAQPDSRYQMFYNEEKLPDYNARMSDIWGYYMGRQYDVASFRSNGVQTNAAVEQVDGARRHVDIQYLQAEILDSLVYPTGGRVKLVYEPHTYSKVAEQYPFRIQIQSGIAGGLRIKTIKEYLPDGKIERKQFSYEREGISTGILSGEPTSVLRGLHRVNYHYGVIEWDFSEGELLPSFLTTHTSYDCLYYIYSEGCLNQLSSTFGANVTYSEVREHLQNGEDGWVEYVYSNHDTPGCMDYRPGAMHGNIDETVIQENFNSMELSRGNLLRKATRSRDGRLVSLEENTYAIDTLCFIPEIHRNIVPIGDYQRLTYCKRFTFFPKLTQQSKTRYSDNSNAQYIETTDYTYDSHRNLTSETRTSGDQTVRDDYTYPGNYPDIPVYTDMSTSGRHALPVEHVRSVDGAVSEAELVTWKQAGAPGDYVPSERFKATPTGLPDFTVLYDGITVNDAYGPPLVRYLDYDAHSNLTQSATPDGTHTSYTWDRDSTHLRGVFVGAERKERSRIWSEQARVTEEEDLSDLHDRFYGNSFTTVADGPVTVNIWFDAGDERDIWGRFDGDSLLSFHCPVPTSSGGLTPIYTCTFQLPAGQHFLSLSTREGVFLPVIPVLHSPGATGVVGDHPGHDPLDPVVIIDPNGKPLRGYLSLTYWGDADYVHVRDEAECAHFSFEDTGDTADGFQSTKSQTEQMTVHLVLNPDRNYTMDRRVKRNGEWVYEQMPFQFNSTDTYTLHAGGAPFDEVRIYADGVQPETCTWWPDGNLRSRTDARGVTESYEYDGLGRLVRVTDNEGKKVAEYTYNYQNR